MDNTPQPPESIPQPSANEVNTTPSSDDKIWIIFCHLSLILGIGFLLPLVVFLVKKDEYPAVAEQAREALNFHISVYLYLFISFLLCFILIGIPLLFIVGIGSAVLSIVATIKVSEGKPYRYPLTIRLV